MKARHCAELARSVRVPYAARIQAASKLEASAQEQGEQGESEEKPTKRRKKSVPPAKRLARPSAKWSQYDDKVGEYDKEDEEEEKKKENVKKDKKKKTKSVRQSRKWSQSEDKEGEYDNEEEEQKANAKQDHNEKELDKTGTEEEERRKPKAKKTKPQAKGKEDAGEGEKKRVVEHILDQRTLTKGHCQGKVQYLVKWRGARPTTGKPWKPQWVDADDMLTHAKHITEYEQRIEMERKELEKRIEEVRKKRETEESLDQIYERLLRENPDAASQYKKTSLWWKAQELFANLPLQPRRKK